MIDATTIRAHQHAAGARGGQRSQALGGSCGGFSSKIHAKVDALGMPISFALSAGACHDSRFSEALWNEEDCDFMIADRGYDDDGFRAKLIERHSVTNTLIILSVWCAMVFFFLDTQINQMWQFKFVIMLLILIFTSLRGLIAIISISRKIFKNDISYFLQRESITVIANAKFINEMLKYGINSLVFVINMLEFDVKGDVEKDFVILGSSYKKSGGLLLKFVIFCFIFYGIWSIPGDWQLTEWRNFFLSAVCVAFSFVALVLWDELLEARTYIFLLRQAVLLKKTGTVIFNEHKVNNGVDVK